MQQAMTALSSGATDQRLRSFLPVGDLKTFAIMPASRHDEDVFGAKLVSVYGDAARPGCKKHRGVVVVFDGETGAPAGIIEAEELTRIRTAAASAAATASLARDDAQTLAVLGCGAQAEAHIHALSCVRKFRDITIWGRDSSRAGAFAKRLQTAGYPVRACESVQLATRQADIICTVTGAVEPILGLADVKPGAHVNAVGSSGPGPVEIAADLVAEATFIADHRESVAAHGAEFLAAQTAGRIGETHIAAEIGDVFGGSHPGRTSETEITLYKSLGHAVQDIAAAAFLLRKHQPELAGE